jgi:thioredoxin-like negative regulator of GroEL
VKAIQADPETDLVKIDVDDFDEISASFGIRAMPTVVFLKDGKGLLIIKSVQWVRPTGNTRAFRQKCCPLASF